MKSYGATRLSAPLWGGWLRRINLRINLHRQCPRQRKKPPSSTPDIAGYFSRLESAMDRGRELKRSRANEESGTRGLKIKARALSLSVVYFCESQKISTTEDYLSLVTERTEFFSLTFADHLPMQSDLIYCFIYLIRHLDAE